MSRATVPTLMRMDSAWVTAVLVTTLSRDSLMVMDSLVCCSRAVMSSVGAPTIRDNAITRIRRKCNRRSCGLLSRLRLLFSCFRTTMSIAMGILLVLALTLVATLLVLRRATGTVAF